MSLINRIDQNLRAHHNRRNKPTNEHNHSENAGSSFERSSNPGFTSFDNTSLYGGRIFRETFALSPTTQQSGYTHRDNAAQSYSFSSTSTSTTTNRRVFGTSTSRAARTSNHTPADFSDLADDDDGNHSESRSAYSTSHGLSVIRHDQQRQNNRDQSRNSIYRQSMNDHRRNNGFRPTNHDQSSVENLDHIGGPLERVHARQSLPELNISMPEQASHQTAGDYENFDVNLSHRPHNTNFEDAYANSRPSSHFLETFPELAEDSEEDRQYLADNMRSQPQHLSLDHPHHHEGFHEVPNNTDSEDDAMVTAIKLALVPTADTENDSCTVCQELYDMEEHRSVRVPGCVHILGGKCILRWLKENPQNMTCPMCRNQIETPMFMRSLRAWAHINRV